MNNPLYCLRKSNNFFFNDFVHNPSRKIVPLKGPKFQWMVGDNHDHAEPKNLTKDIPKIVDNVLACDDN